MASQAFLNNTHVPLLDSFLYALDNHIEELLIRLNKLYQIMENIPADQTERHIRLDLLVKQCSLEADWALKTFNGYKALKETAAPLPNVERAVNGL
ncbi:hypothetical protein ACHAPT_004629 [Fusarium lateritium]